MTDWAQLTYAYDTAAAHGQELVMQAVLHVFGQATCPLCSTEFSVSGRVL
ncbi:MAG: hypothetical protein QOF58_6066 [Pseudonocardiales bacterium]|jgi:hypothetical protein|nr:hypothetical protein [Pseudonocardiales bacterium]